MSDTLVFVFSDAEKCRTMAGPLVEQGWTIEVFDPTAADVLQSTETASPVATVFDLGSDPKQLVRELAKAMLADPDLSRPLLVFVGGDESAVAEIKAEVPFGVFVGPDELTWVLKHLVYKD